MKKIFHIFKKPQVLIILALGTLFLSLGVVGNIVGGKNAGCGGDYDNKIDTENDTENGVNKQNEIYSEEEALEPSLSPYVEDEEGVVGKFALAKANKKERDCTIPDGLFKEEIRKTLNIKDKREPLRRELDSIKNLLLDGNPDNHVNIDFSGIGCLAKLSELCVRYYNISSLGEIKKTRVRGIVLRDGKIDENELSKLNISSLKQIFLNNLGLMNVEGLNAPQAESISLSFNPINEESLSKILSLKNLKRLYLSGLGLNDSFGKIKKKLPKLVMLNLRENKLKNIDFLLDVNQFPKLKEHLDLRDNPISCTNMDTINQLKQRIKNLLIDENYNERCASFTPSWPSSEALNNLIHDNWNNNRLNLINDINAYFTAVDGDLCTTRTQILYDVQGFTNNLLKYAVKKKDLALLDQLARLYSIPLNYLRDVNTCTYPYLYDENNVFHYTLELPLDRPIRMWSNESNRAFEQILDISQFLHLASEALLAFVKLQPNERTDSINSFIGRYPSVLFEHYQRWIYGDKIFQVKGWGCQPYNEANLNHFDFMKKKLTRQFKPNGRDPISYCNSVNDTDLWIFSGLLNLLAANRIDSSLVSIPRENINSFVDYLILAFNLIDSRFSESNLFDFNGNPRTGLIFDNGEFRDHPDQAAYAGYTGETFPEVADMAKADTDYDVSHARRFVHVFGALYENSLVITGRQFPSTEQMERLVAQFAYGNFNKDLNRPLHANFMNGINGWYRVNYEGRIGFGYPPYGLTDAAPNGGYGIWSSFNDDVERIMDAHYRVLTSNYLIDKSPRKNDLAGSNLRINNDGVIGKSAEFNGDTSTIGCGKGAGFDSSSGAIEFWIKPQAMGAEYDIFNRFEKGYEDFLLVRLNRNGSFLLLIEDDNLTKVSLTSNTTINDTNWHHIVITQNGEGAEIYVDGNNSNANGTNSNYWTSHLVFKGGCRFGISHWGKFTGSLDEIRFYNRALSDDEIRNHYAGLFESNNGLMLHLSFDEERDGVLIEFNDRYYNSTTFINYVKQQPKEGFDPRDSLNMLQFLPVLGLQRNYR